MATLASELRRICDMYQDIAAKQDDSTWSHAYRFAVSSIVKDIKSRIDDQSSATKHPHLGLRDLVAHARELGYDVVQGHGRIMISLPVSVSMGEILIDEQFPKQVEVPQLTPVGADPISPSSVF